MHTNSDRDEMSRERNTNMGKFTFVVGAGIGFVVGSRFGTGPYEQLESKVRQISRRPDVQDTVGQVRTAATEQMGAVAQKVGDKMPGFGGSSDEKASAPTAQVPDHYADPQDLEFGKAAADKEEALDAQLARGDSLQNIEGEEKDLLDNGDLTLPRAADQQQLADGTPNRRSRP
jgi:hypothetical protein